MISHSALVRPSNLGRDYSTLTVGGWYARVVRAEGLQPVCCCGKNTDRAHEQTETYDTKSEPQSITYDD